MAVDPPFYPCFLLSALQEKLAGSAMGAPDMQLLVHAGDFAEILLCACGVSTVDLASTSGEIIPAVGIQASSAKSLSV